MTAALTVAPTTGEMADETETTGTAPEVCQACKTDHLRGTACTVAEGGQPLTMTCIRCRWLYGEIPTAYDDPARGWTCSACRGTDGYPTSWTALYTRWAGTYENDWNGNPGPDNGDYVDLIEKVALNGWYVPPQTIALTAGRFALEQLFGRQERTDWIHRYSNRLTMYLFPGSGYRGIPIVTFDQHVTTSLKIAGVSS